MFPKGGGAMRRTVLLLLASLFATLAWPHLAFAEKRVALIIGNGAYANATQLPNPRNDAEDVAAALKREGFETIVGIDLDQAKMQDTAIEFARAAREADVALFYYSCHAMQFAGINYLMPVDAKLSDEADLRRMARVDDILADLQQAKNLRILVLDACRDNPFADQLKRSIGLTRAASLQRGLARIDTPEGMIVAFSTQAQRTAEDGTGRNSPYTTAFLKHIEEPEEIGRVFRRISTDVYEATEHSQLPELALSMIGEYYLHGEPSGAPASPSQSSPPPPPVTNPALDAWNAAKATDNASVLEAFIAKFGDSFYAELAKAKLAELQKKEDETKVALALPPNLEPKPEHKVGETFRDCPNCPEMVVVPAGKFMMGSPNDEVGRFDNEGPQHEVRIAGAFAVGKFEVTRDEFEAFVNDSGYDAGSRCWTDENKKAGWRSGRSFLNPGYAQPGNGPAACINWNDAKAYAAWLAHKTGKGYRLLSEAEWEYAARAGSTLKFIKARTEDELCQYANGPDLTAKKTNRDWKVPNCTDGYVFAAPVGGYAPNDFGLYDMQGNLWEWVGDCFHNNYKGAPSDGSAWTSDDCAKPVGRGAAWNNMPRSLRAAMRGSAPLKDRDSANGLRVARTLGP
jgi:formylglycine-generating enzyme required for sulfatase activity